MTTKTAISWTDYSSNPIKYRDRETNRTVWACVKKSDGCANCYSEALALRWNKGRAFSRPNIETVEPFFDEAEVKRLLSARAIPSGSKVFVGDMTDLFGPWVPDHVLFRLWCVFARRPDVTWQVLTKRPERMQAFVSRWADVEHEEAPSLMVRGPDAVREMHRSGRARLFADDLESRGAPPPGASYPTYDWMGGPRWHPAVLPNVWLGTSVEDQRAADERIPHLLATPAAVRFLSCEPLLGTVRLPMAQLFGAARPTGKFRTDPSRGVRQLQITVDRSSLLLHWVITGGESGPRHRAMDLDWLRAIVEQCLEAGIAVWTKQDSGLYPGRQGRIPDELWLHDFPRAAVPGIFPEEQG